MATYHPDFIVGTEKNIYLIETKGNDKLFDKNVRQKQTTAVEWTRKINELKPEERMNREWECSLVRIISMGCLQMVLLLPTSATGARFRSLPLWESCSYKPAANGEKERITRE